MNMNKKAQMSILLIILVAIIAVIFIGIMWIAGSYNSLVQKDVAVEKYWGNVESAYQRRADLIPNLVETVKGVANFEQETYIGVAEARTQWANAKSVNEKIDASQSLDSALSRLMVAVEAYPQLKANVNFIALQDELAGTENRIQYERNKYNEIVQSYKTSVRSFPTNFIAGMFGFTVDKWSMFKAQEGAENSPKVNFSN